MDGDSLPADHRCHEICNLFLNSVVGDESLKLVEYLRISRDDAVPEFNVSSANVSQSHYAVIHNFVARRPRDFLN